MKYLLTLLVVCILNHSFAQPKIKGIAGFELGSTLKSVLSKLDSEKVNYLDLDTVSDVYKISHGIVSKDTKGIIEINVPKYEISNVSFGSMVLSFVNDSLYLVESGGDMSSLFDALTIKYGKSKLIEFNKKIHCQFIYTGNIVEKEENTSMNYWRDDSKVTCFIIAGNHFNKDCEETFFSNFQLESVPLSIKRGG